MLATSTFCKFLMAYSIMSSRCGVLEPQKSTGQLPAHWDYENQTDWEEAYPLCKGKAMRQSPIDIITSDAIEHNLMVLEFIDYDQELQISAKNSGHSVSVSPQADRDETKPRVRLNWIESEFELQEVHFHWGPAVQRPGSEHRIDGQQASAEMHMVHFKKGVTEDQIGDVPNSVTVVGVFIMPTESSKTNKELENIVEASTQVNGTDPSVEKPGPRTENMKNLLPETMRKFYAYEGSLTTPPCYETVNWIVLSNPIYLSPEKLGELENINTSDGSGTHKINQNFREVQPLVGRSVFSSTNIKEFTSVNLQVQQQAESPEFGGQL